MSTQSQIDRIKNNISDAYSVAEARGAEMPPVKNSDNLANALNTIPFGSDQTKPIILTEGMHYGDTLPPEKPEGRLFFLPENLLDRIYPIGSIYLSASAASPAALFGGSWTQIKDRFLLAAGNSYSAGSTGGEASHTLTVDEMPGHNHVINTTYGSVATASNTSGKIAAGGSSNTWIWEATTTNLRGNGVAHNNMPPYLTVYVWQRTG